MANRTERYRAALAEQPSEERAKQEAEAARQEKQRAVKAAREALTPAELRRLADEIEREA